MNVKSIVISEALVKILSFITIIVFIPMYIKRGGAETYGVIVYYLSIFTLIFRFASMGVLDSLTRYMSRKRHKILEKYYIRMSFFLSTIILFFSILVFLVLTNYFKDQLSANDFSVTAIQKVGILCVAVLQVLFTLWLSISRQLDSQAKYYKKVFTQQALASIGLGLVLYSANYTLAAFLLSYYLIPILVSFPYKLLLKSITEKVRFSKRIFRIFGYSGVFLLAGSLSAIYAESIMRIIVGNTAGKAILSDFVVAFNYSTALTVGMYAGVAVGMQILLFRNAKKNNYSDEANVLTVPLLFQAIFASIFFVMLMNSQAEVLLSGVFNSEIFKVFLIFFGARLLEVNLYAIGDWMSSRSIKNQNLISIFSFLTTSVTIIVVWIFDLKQVTMLALSYLVIILLQTIFLLVMSHRLGLRYGKVVLGLYIVQGLLYYGFNYLVGPHHPGIGYAYVGLASILYVLITRKYAWHV